MNDDENKPSRLHELAERLAAKITDLPRHGHDVSSERRVPKGQSGGGQWTDGGTSSGSRRSGRSTKVRTVAAFMDARRNGATSPRPTRSGRLANSRTPATFVDDRGEPILDKDGKTMQLPSDVDLRFFVDQGIEAAYSQPAIFTDTPGMTAFVTLANFYPGGIWDIQRVGPSGQYVYVSAFRDAANVALGLYGAAADLPQSVVLEIANQVARFSSNFAKNDPRAKNFTHLPQRDVDDIKQGYALFRSGRIKSSR
jgi:hypothetical protein